MFVWNHQAVHWAMPCPPGPQGHIAAACTAGHPRRGPKPEALGTIRGLTKQNGNLSWFHLRFSWVLSIHRIAKVPFLPMIAMEK